MDQIAMDQIAMDQIAMAPSTATSSAGELCPANVPAESGRI